MSQVAEEIASSAVWFFWRAAAGAAAGLGGERLSGTRSPTGPGWPACRRGTRPPSPSRWGCWPWGAPPRAAPSPPAVWGRWRGPAAPAESARRRGGASPNPCAGRRSRSSGRCCSRCRSRSLCARSSSSSAGTAGDNLSAGACSAPFLGCVLRPGPCAAALTTYPGCAPHPKPRTPSRTVRHSPKYVPKPSPCTTAQTTSLFLDCATHPGPCAPSQSMHHVPNPIPKPCPCTTSQTT